MIDFKKFFSEKFPETKEIGKDERLIDCISKDCPNPKSHMYVNVEKGVFLCHRCGISGNSRAFLCLYYGLPYGEIERNYSALYGIEENYFQTVSISCKKILSVSEKIKDVNSFKINLPKDYVPLTKMPKFLEKRRVPSKVIKHFEIGYCADGYYKNRLIFPIYTAGCSSFVAYSTFPKKVLNRYKKLAAQKPFNKKYNKNKKKTLNPLSSLSHLLLYNYDKVSMRCEKLIVVEGIFDAIRIWLFGYDVVAIFGTHFSSVQRNLLLAKQAAEIIFIFDGDVWCDEKKTRIANRAVQKTAAYHPGTVSMVKLEKNIDPDDIKNKKIFKELLNKRVFFDEII